MVIYRLSIRPSISYTIAAAVLWSVELLKHTFISQVCTTFLLLRQYLVWFQKKNNLRKKTVRTGQLAVLKVTGWQF